MDLMINALLSVQFLGDYFLFIGTVLLLQNIHRLHDCKSISLKTQILLTIIFTIRYVDLAVTYISLSKIFTNSYMIPVCIVLYNFAKFAHIITCWILVILLIIKKYENSIFDTFRWELLIIISATLALILNYKFEIFEIFWMFSIYLESVAIIPQIHLNSKIKCTENIIFYYVCLMSLYKLSYLSNWIYTSFYLNFRFDRIAFAAGIVQLIIYVDFFVNNTWFMKSSSNSLKKVPHNDVEKLKISVQIV